MSTKNRAPRLPVNHWAKYRQTITDLYIRQDKTLKELVKIMKQDHDFHAIPRQFTQKFKSWDLYKYERRSGEHKPRRTSSIYRDGRVGLRKCRSLVSVTFTPDHEAALEFQETEEIDYYGGDSHANVDRRRQDSAILNPTSGTVGAISSSAITIEDEDDDEISKNVTSPPIEKGLAGTTTIVPTSDAGANSVRPYWNALYGQDIPWLELDGETLPHPEKLEKSKDPRHEVGMRLKKQSLVASAIWQLWYVGVLNDFESYQARGLDMPAPPLVEFDLKAWMRLYPRYTRPESGVRWPLQPFPEPNYPKLTWIDFTGYGRAMSLGVVLPSLDLADGIPSTHRLIASMMLDPRGNWALRRCFEIILTYFEAELRKQSTDAEKPCERFVKEFTLTLSESEERSIAGHSDQENSAAMLAMVSYRQFAELDRLNTITKHQELDALLNRGAEFSAQRAFVWAARLILYHASSELDQSPLPTHLCTRALDRCRRIREMINSPSYQHHFADVWQDANFANLWAEWICCDSEVFSHYSPT